MLPERLTWIDETNRGQYYFLDPEDRCLFFSDFFSKRGWSAGYTNQLIKNYKRTPGEIAASGKAAALQYYKNKAIADVAAALRKVLSRAAVESRTFVPIPSSKVMHDPDHCDRLERTLDAAFSGYAADIRPMLRQTTSTQADHLSGGGRQRYQELLDITELDPVLATTPPRPEIVLFDDVLTSGKHFKVAKTRLHEHYPGHPIIGLFIARSVHASPFEHFDAEDF